ncbi:hypothetical protein [uncultured Winogradskyella sp.]|uniref:hypothetical protein n=1 Tax=uncultured Winogradskyella sp. TaxID=395353 RepID=UPI002605C515|nr:hypothetical protein [uncultured Winogradskyella sp.]
MKKQVLFLAMMLLGITSATATTAGDVVLNGEDFNNARYRFTEPIVFIERGVEFLIFTDGSFDFNTEIFSTLPEDDQYYYRRNRRSTNRTYGAPGTRYHNGDRGVLVRHDRLGRVRRIGNVFINYDRQGRVKRVGSVYMSYRRGQLKQVGGLRILYNRYGDVIGTRGHVNFNNQGCGFCGTTTCTIDHFSSTSNDWNDDWNDDDDYYYYRKNGKVKKQKKHKY